VRGPGPGVTQSNRKAAQFTMQPDVAGIEPVTPHITLSVTAIGDNLSVASARQYCHPERTGF